MQNVMELDLKKFSDPKTLTFGVWGLKTSLGKFGPKAFGKGLIKPVCSELTVCIIVYLKISFFD